MGTKPIADKIDSHGRVWDCLDFNIDWATVRNIAVPITTKFTFRTNGTCQSPRIPGIGWSYFGADPDWGEKQASQLKVELEASLAMHDVKITSMIQGSIEVVPRQLHKGVMVRKLMERLNAKRAGKMPAFVMIMGDEESDDMMYEELYQIIGASAPAAHGTDMKAFTINVGKRVTPAKLYMNDVQDVECLLDALASSAFTSDILPQRRSRSLSKSNLLSSGILSTSTSSNTVEMVVDSAMLF